MTMSKIQKNGKPPAEQEFFLRTGARCCVLSLKSARASGDYLLDRGDGSAESVKDYEVPFDESDTYKKIEDIEDILDENQGSEHDTANIRSRCHALCLGAMFCGNGMEYEEVQEEQPRPVGSLV